MSKHPHEVERFTVGRCTAIVELDQDPGSPRERDNVGTMVCWHRNYRLGDVNGRETYGDGDDFIRALAGDHTDNDVQEMDIEECWKIVRDWFVILPLGLYDHSGISMFVGGRGDVASDSAGWDTSNIGYIYCKLDKALHEWGTKGKEDMRWDGPAQFTLKPDGTPHTLREATEKYLRGEVTDYNQFLTGQVYSYVVEDEHGEVTDSCHGFYGDIEYVRGEARVAAESEDERLRNLEEQTAIAECYP